MGYQTQGLGVGLSSLIQDRCDVLERYSILAWQRLTCTHTVLFSRANVMLLYICIRPPHCVCGLFIKLVSFGVLKRAFPTILVFQVASQLNTGT